MPTSVVAKLAQQGNPRCGGRPRINPSNHPSVILTNSEPDDQGKVAKDSILSVRTSSEGEERARMNGQRTYPSGLIPFHRSCASPYGLRTARTPSRHHPGWLDSTGPRYVTRVDYRGAGGRYPNRETAVFLATVTLVTTRYPTLLADIMNCGRSGLRHYDTTGDVRKRGQ